MTNHMNPHQWYTLAQLARLTGWSVAEVEKDVEMLELRLRVRVDHRRMVRRR